MAKRIKILNIAGARPNFMKIAPLIEEMKKRKGINYVLVHTGQHYDFELSKIFFSELKIPKPDYNLGVGSGSHTWQIAKIMERIEPIFKKEKPDLVVVVGDVNSTLAGALTALKLNIPLVHIEAGLRSFNKGMPEESNRILTDYISDYLFATEASAVKNLLKEGINKKKIFLVGNIMIDTLLKYKNKALKIPILKRFNLQKQNYTVLTLHRPENVDDKMTLQGILEAFEKIQRNIKIIWSIHPRTKKQLRKFGFLGKINKMENLIITSPLGYLEMLSLIQQSKFVLTDSGGIQEETTALGIPCLTLREETERPITAQIGTNKVIGVKKEVIIKESLGIINNPPKKGKIPKYWDGKTSKRIIKILDKIKNI